MAAFDPEKFEDKYEHYFPELQRAYKNAFEHMNDRYDSELVHAIDQAVLSRSEPLYEDGEFRLALPADPLDRLEGISFEEHEARDVLDAYVDRIEVELRAVFEMEE